MSLKIIFAVEGQHIFQAGTVQTNNDAKSLEY